MTEVTIGPLALPASQLVTFGAVMLGAALGNRGAQSDGVQAERSLWLVIGIAVLAGRAAYSRTGAWANCLPPRWPSDWNNW